MYPKWLPELKQLLINGDDYFEVWNYFWDRIDENPRIMKLGRSVRHVFVEQVVHKVGKSLFKKDVPVYNVMLIRWRKPRFVHGSFHINGKIGSVMYFEKEMIGSVGVANAFGEESIVSRFTCFVKDDGSQSVSFSLN